MTVIYIGNPYEVKSSSNSCVSFTCRNNACTNVNCKGFYCTIHTCEDKRNTPEFDDDAVYDLIRCNALF